MLLSLPTARPAPGCIHTRRDQIDINLLPLVCSYKACGNCTAYGTFPCAWSVCARRHKLRLHAASFRNLCGGQAVCVRACSCGSLSCRLRLRPPAPPPHPPPPRYKIAFTLGGLVGMYFTRQLYQARRFARRLTAPRPGETPDVVPLQCRLGPVACRQGTRMRAKRLWLPAEQSVAFLSVLSVLFPLRRITRCRIAPEGRSAGSAARIRRRTRTRSRDEAEAAPADHARFANSRIRQSSSAPPAARGGRCSRGKQQVCACWRRGAAAAAAATRRDKTP